MKRAAIIRLIPSLVGAFVLLTACEHKDLCFDHEDHAPRTAVQIDATYEREWQYTLDGATDWSHYAQWDQTFGFPYDSLRPAVPDGLRVQVYNSDGTHNVMNLPPEGDVVQMRPGEHALLFYNNDTEYIVFDDMASFASARATTRSRSRVSYKGNTFMEGEPENTVNAPDMLYGSYIDSYTAVSQPEVSHLPVTMHPLVFTYLVRYEFSHGLEYVALARGALAGMAGAVWLNSGRTASETATVLYDCTLEDFGVEAVVRSFGVPDYPNDHYTNPSRVAEQRYALNLEVRLKNGLVKSFDFDVTDQVAAQPQGGVIVVSDIAISDDEGQSGGSGFDVSVDSWGEYEDIELPL